MKEIVKNKECKKRDVVCRKIIEYGILGLIVFSPLPAASVYEWSILVIQLTVLFMLLWFQRLGEEYPQVLFGVIWLSSDQINPQLLLP